LQPHLSQLYPVSDEHVYLIRPESVRRDMCACRIEIFSIGSARQLLVKRGSGRDTSKKRSPSTGMPLFQFHADQILNARRRSIVLLVVHLMQGQHARLHQLRSLSCMVSVVPRWDLCLTIPLGASCMISTFHPVTDRIQSLDIRVKIKSGEQQRREGKDTEGRRKC
jgi:hypothetical protein